MDIRKAHHIEAVGISPVGVAKTQWALREPNGHIDPVGIQTAHQWAFRYGGRRERLLVGVQKAHHIEAVGIWKRSPVGIPKAQWAHRLSGHCESPVGT